MRVCWILISILPMASGVCYATAQQPEPPGQLVREVVYNELQDHQRHGYWRYWIEKHNQQSTQLEQQVETLDGPIKRLLQTDGHPLDTGSRQMEMARLERLVNSPREQANHRQAYAEDEAHVTRVFALLPVAYDFEYAGDEDGCHHLRFHPSPTYAPRTIEQRIIHSMSGDLWIDASNKRLSRLQGRIEASVDFGFGLLGRLDKGGWFQMRRVQVSPTEWKTDRLEVHMSGRAFVLKTISRDTNEVRGGFAALPSGINLVQGIKILDQVDPRAPESTMARVSPVSLDKRR
jgi:hypothetical protein